MKYDKKEINYNIENLMRMLELYNMPTIGSGAASDKEMQMFKAAQRMQMPMPLVPTGRLRVPVMGSGVASDKEMEMFEAAMGSGAVSDQEMDILVNFLKNYKPLKFKNYYKGLLQE